MDTNRTDKSLLIAAARKGEGSNALSALLSGADLARARFPGRPENHVDEQDRYTGMT